MGFERMRYRPEIDGLRAVCVIGVIGFHAGAGLAGGFVGVDVFFVISGFLITGIIADEMRTGRFSLAAFWERRIRRIFPALALVQAVTLALGVCLYLPQELNGLAKESLHVSLSVPNVHYWRSFGYFTNFPLFKPLLHTWSLGVEEQFYVVFPLVMIALARLPRSWTIRLLAVLAGVSFLVNLWWTFRGNAMSAFYLLPFRAWELLAGCSLALVNPLEKLGPRWREILSASGIGAILASMAWLNENLPFPGYWAAAPVAGAWLFIGANGGGVTRSARILASPWPVQVGKLSYSLYLWHWPLIVFPAVFLHDFRLIRAMCVAAAFPIAYLAWKYVETPFRRREVCPSRRSMFGAFAATNLVAIGIAGSIGLSGGMKFRLALLPGPARNLQDSDLKLPDFRTSTPQQHLAGHVTVLGDMKQPRPAFLLWGDSHALMTAHAFDEAARDSGISGLFVAQPGANVVPRRTGTDAAASSLVAQGILKDIARRRIAHLILVSCWTEYLDDPAGPADFAAFLDTIARECPETTVHVFDDVPFQNYDPPRLASYRMILASLFPATFAYEKTSADRYMAVLEATTSPGLRLTHNPAVVRHRIDPNLVDGTGHFRWRNDDHFFYSDNNHLTQYGVRTYYGMGITGLMRAITVTQPAMPPSND